MVWKTEESYLETKRIKQGTAKMNPDFIRLSKFIKQHSGSAPLNIIHDLLNKETPRLEIIMEYWEDETKLNSPEQAPLKGLILKKFDELVPGQTAGSFFPFLKRPKKTYLSEGMFVFFSSFERVALQDTSESVPKNLLENFIASLAQPEIWKTVKMAWGFVVMFYTDEQAKKFERQGLKSEISKKYATLITPFDEFGYLRKKANAVSFDSKENFDRNYEGNWQYYFS